MLTAQHNVVVLAAILNSFEKSVYSVDKHREHQRTNDPYRAKTNTYSNYEGSRESVHKSGIAI